jgi:hypothetical protein
LQVIFIIDGFIFHIGLFARKLTNCYPKNDFP